MKTLIVLCVLLGGCASFDAAQRVVAQAGAKAADESLETGLWSVCQTPTIGAWIRRFGHAPAQAEGWRRLCGGEVTELPK